MPKKSKLQELKDLLNLGRWDSFWHWLENVENFFDDPIDGAKEWLHCHKLPFGYQLNISVLMKNRTTTWDIIRMQGNYDNCDPEDLPEIPEQD